MSATTLLAAVAQDRATALRGARTAMDGVPMPPATTMSANAATGPIAFGSCHSQRRA